ncbi:MAG: ornithine cyclodeaminase family protein [Pseudomonadota bacterium]|nr:ornithine cyclodeaminase family protein [Pseudomonadota bacterium]
MKIITLDEIKKRLIDIDVIVAVEQCFAAFSAGDIVVPPPGELTFQDPPGDVHIKYGYDLSSDYYVIKIASGFYQSDPSCQGMLLVFTKQSGKAVALLQDECYLTNIRTAAAGAIAAKYCAPSVVHRIGIVGCGVQAQLQLAYLRKITACDQIIVYGLSDESLANFQQHCPQKITTTLDIAELAATCNLIVTTTPSHKPLFDLSMIKPGTHITAIGSDTPAKQELHVDILQAADLIVTDSKQQSLSRGEISHALAKKVIAPEDVVEIGDIIRGKAIGRANDQQITIADFTGIAAQDIAIAEAVLGQRLVASSTE